MTPAYRKRYAIRNFAGGLPMLQIIVIVVVVLIVALLLYAGTRPGSFKVERSAGIKAPPERIFALIDDFHQWAVWSPYEKLDPAMKRSFEGPVSGVGAVYAWDGNSKAGAGRMEITQSTPASKIAIQLDFSRPFEGHNIAEFTFVPNGEVTTVHWSMHGPSPFMHKLMGMFFNLDHFIGRDFETGLNNLKAATEQ